MADPRQVSQRQIINFIVIGPIQNKLRMATGMCMVSGFLLKGANLPSTKYIYVYIVHLITHTYAYMNVYIYKNIYVCVCV